MIEFGLSDIYEFEPELAKRHPENKDIKSTVRGTLQKLRDAGLVIFVKNGRYRVSPKFVGEKS